MSNSFPVASIPGIHHVTAIAGDPARNVHFYTKRLGLRLVKRTVNFDEPGTHHLYYGDAAGTPGTILTFFPGPGAPRGTRGRGQATAVAFSVPAGSLGWWRDHLRRHEVPHEAIVRRGEDEVLPFLDPDGLALELVAHQGPGPGEPWAGPVPQEHGIRGFHSVTLMEADAARTVRVLEGAMGFTRREPAEDGAGEGRSRFATGAGGASAFVDILDRPQGPLGRMAAGIVHHVAWRVTDDAEQNTARTAVTVAGLRATPVIDRCYFRSVYFREPGGVLFELATDPPGFTIDEPLDSLGTRLCLPPWYEGKRTAIEASLPPLFPEGDDA
jgi:glyoxalase family protein